MASTQLQQHRLMILNRTKLSSILFPIMVTTQSKTSQIIQSCNASTTSVGEILSPQRPTVALLEKVQVIDKDIESKSYPESKSEPDLEIPSEPVAASTTNTSESEDVYENCWAPLLDPKENPKKMQIPLKVKRIPKSIAGVKKGNGFGECLEETTNSAPLVVARKHLDNLNLGGKFLGILSCMFNKEAGHFQFILGDMMLKYRPDENKWFGQDTGAIVFYSYFQTYADKEISQAVAQSQSQTGEYKLFNYKDSYNPKATKLSSNSLGYSVEERDVDVYYLKRYDTGDKAYAEHAAYYYESHPDRKPEFERRSKNTAFRKKFEYYWLGNIEISADGEKMRFNYILNETDSDSKSVISKSVISGWKKFKTHNSLLLDSESELAIAEGKKFQPKFDSPFKIDLESFITEFKLEEYLVKFPFNYLPESWLFGAKTRKIGVTNCVSFVGFLVRSFVDPFLHAKDGYLQLLSFDSVESLKKFEDLIYDKVSCYWGFEYGYKTLYEMI